MTLRELRKRMEEMEKEYGGDTIVNVSLMDGEAPTIEEIEDVWLDGENAIHFN